MRSLLTALILLAGCAALNAQNTVTVINYAGFPGLFPVAPGSLASAYGAGTVPEQGTTVYNPLPKELAGVRVRVNGVEAPLYYVGPAVINFEVPVATAVGRATVEVTLNGNVIGRGNFNVYSWGPGLASSDPAGTQQGIIQNQDFSVNSSTRRARAGEVIQIYATGCGAVNPQVQDGTPPTGLAPTVAPVRVFVGNDEARVEFAGAHPAYPGLCQINATVPAGSRVTGATPVFFTVNGIASNPVIVWMQ
jgi:uncharacterized protein (TIGR03437 family)